MKGTQPPRAMGGVITARGEDLAKGFDEKGYRRTMTALLGTEAGPALMNQRSLLEGVLRRAAALNELKRQGVLDAELEHTLAWQLGLEEFHASALDSGPAASTPLDFGTAPTFSVVPRDPGMEISVIDVTDDVLTGQGIKALRQSAIEFAESHSIFGRHDNADQGWQVLVNAASLRHQFGNFGAQHIHAVVQLPALIRSAVLTEVAPHNPPSPEWKGVSRLKAAMRFRGEVYSVKLTVKEHTSQGHKLYDLKALEIEVEPGGKVLPDRTAGAALESGPAPGSTVKLNQIAPEVNLTSERQRTSKNESGTAAGDGKAEERGQSGPGGSATSFSMVPDDAQSRVDDQPENTETSYDEHAVTDPRTRQRSLVSGPYFDERARPALRDHNRRRLGQAQSLYREPEPAGVAALGEDEESIEFIARRLGIPIVRLPDLGIVRDRHGVLRAADERRLKKLRPGSEAQPFLDRDQGVVYKVMALDESGNAGKMLAAKLEEDGRWEVGNRPASDLETLRKLALISERGGLATEIVGITSRGYWIIKQPEARPVAEADFEKARQEAVVAFGAVSLQASGLEHVWVFTHEGKPWLLGDLHRQNIMKDSAGQARVMDALICPMPEQMAHDLPPRPGPGEHILLPGASGFRSQQ